MDTMNKRKHHVFTTEIMENTYLLGKILIFGFRNTDFDRWRLAALLVGHYTSYYDKEYFFFKNNTIIIWIQVQFYKIVTRNMVSQ